MIVKLTKEQIELLLGLLPLLPVNGPLEKVMELGRIVDEIKVALTAANEGD